MNELELIQFLVHHQKRFIQIDLKKTLNILNSFVIGPIKDIYLLVLIATSYLPKVENFIF